MKKVFIITGEHSGDKHAAAVVRELKKICEDLTLEGTGGENLAAQGVKLFSGHQKMSAVGITLKSVFNHLTLGLRLVNYLKNEFKPDLVLLVDYGAFNLQVSKHLKRAGFKTVFFIPPQVWASRKRRVRTIKANIDKVLTIFPFEGRLYEEVGVPYEYVGHPLINELPVATNREEFFARHGLDPEKRLVSIFPGSRPFEIKHLLKVFLKCIKIIEKACPSVQFAFSHAPNLKDDAFKIPYKTIKGENHALLSVSDALILASGTVALEAALYRTPFVVAYRGPFLFYLIYLVVRRIKKACLVNIITGRDVVEEFLMYDAEPKKISKGVLRLLNDADARAAQIKGFEETEEILSKGVQEGCAYQAARAVCKELGG
ncbi:lipid-A-disaccharide synthase [Candidatus Gastranaerophilus sp. (ex Termes propinquus)]|nr:lipid-A-disaccharide synthase [Candidatus Gastranaerophilus sp. (ex Termes propinquus)]